jgi:hypothetical protein
MSKISGKTGKLIYGTSTEIPITGWTLDRQIGLKEVSDSSSTAGKDFIVDKLYEVDGSMEGFVSTGDTQPGLGDTLALKLYYDETRYWSGSGIVTSIGESLTVSGGDAVKVAYKFKGTGAWSRTNAA